MKERQLFNEGWEFTKQPLDTPLEEVNKRSESFTSVELPHDWLIYNTNDLYENSTGWYRKKFYLEKELDTRYLLRFDGVYMDSTIYVNDQKAGEWKYGYSAFEVELTPYLKQGENEIKVSVRHQSPNSRWYTGAGIYRNVWFKQIKKTHIVSDGIYITATPKEAVGFEKKSIGRVEIDTEIMCYKKAKVSYLIRKKYTGETVATLEERIEPQDKLQLISSVIEVESPCLWDIEAPHLYELVTTLSIDGKEEQIERVTFGFRTLIYNPERGFFLNNKPIKLNGVCEHHDLGCLGAAYYQTAVRRKFKTLQKMGVNAIRTAHNMPAEEWMDLADEMGMLILSESFDMWEKPKTAYDYARFFPEWYEKDVASWIRRDRNHPSVIMWSIGNEIYDTHEGERGQEITRALLQEVHKHDPKGHAPVTIGSNYMPWENAQKCADIVKLAGYNYSEKYYEVHHKLHPDWIIYGSETGSIVQSRGIYHFPFGQSILADDDEQCSSLGNSTTSWGAKSIEECIINERDCSFSCGQFLWSGYDYIGEPTPYHTKNSYFGQIDTAGFPKDSYYMYQAEWTDYKLAPMIHLFPYWDFNVGQLIDIRVCSNAPKVELFFNGESKGCFEIDHQYGKQLLGHWQLPYMQGELEAVAYDDEGNIIARDRKKSFAEAAQIVLTPDKTEILAEGNDLVFIEISMVDSQGNPVENANNRVKVEITGAGKLLGLDNGDSTDRDSYKGIRRRLFSGKLLAIIGIDKNNKEAKEIEVNVSSAYLPSASLTLKVIGENAIIKEQTHLNLNQGGLIQRDLEDEIDIPVRKIEIISPEGNRLSKELQEVEAYAVIYPQYATDQKLVWSVVDDAGIPSHLAKLKVEGNKAIIKAIGDGSFRLRCMSENGTGNICIISQLDFSISGIGKTYLDPYGFISGGVYTFSKGNVSNGNEKGVATARDGETQVGFQNIDFGSYGSDEITIPIFALSSEPYRIQIWEGIPGEEKSELVGDVIYQKPSIWNVYQEETFKLKKRIKGITSICFVLKQKIHIKGFFFKKYNRAFETLYAIENNSIYGDHFKVTEEGVKEIGNNVTLTFEKMDFGEQGISKLVVCGNSPIEKNSIHVRFESDLGEDKQLIEFLKTQGEEVRTYSLDKVTGIQNISFVFLPGSCFDFNWFRFEV